MNVQLSSYYRGIAAKRLADSEINSNQHEFNGSSRLKEILGTEKGSFSGQIIYIADDEDHIIEKSCNYTWYDVRENNPDRSPEYRLYFSDSEVIAGSSPEDLVIIGVKNNYEIFVYIAPAGSTSERQLLYLFGLEEVNRRFTVKDFGEEDIDIGYAGRYILESLNIVAASSEAENYLDEMLSRFGSTFPSTADFSLYARSTVNNTNVIEDPDTALMAWWEREGQLLRLFEKEIVQHKLQQGFDNNVDEFISFALTVINRRKSRAGHSFENHLLTIFTENQLRFTRGGITELNKKPDFIFPDIDKYRDPEYSSDMLNMLGAKTTLKDRWRQVLSEADRITKKHLVTLEPAISTNQTNEMIQHDIQLVIPAPLLTTYTDEQKNTIINLKDFIEEIKAKQTDI